MKRNQLVLAGIALLLASSLMACGGTSAPSSLPVEESSMAETSVQESSESSSDLSSLMSSHEEISSAGTSTEQGTSSSKPESKSKDQNPISSKKQSDTSSKPKKDTSSKSATTSKPDSSKPTSSKDTSSKKASSKPTSSKETENSGNAWGSVSKMTGDCKAYAQSIGLEWDGSLDKGNSHWVTPINSTAFDSTSAFKSKVHSRTSYLKSQGFEYIRVYFKKSGNGYKVYHFAG